MGLRADVEARGGPTQILAVAGMAAAVLAGYPQVLLALGEPKALLHFNLVKLVVYGGAVFLAVGSGLTAVALTVVAVYVAIVVAAYGVMLAPRLGIPLRQVAAELVPASAGCVALLTATVPLTALLEPVLPAALLIVTVGVLGLVVHCAVLRAGFAPVWHDLTALASRVAPLRARWRPREPVVPEAPPAVVVADVRSAG